MERDTIVERIRAHAPQLGEFDIAKLSLFGSVARGDSGPESDVDVLVEFRGAATFDNFMGLKLFLEDLLDRRVDLVTTGALRQEIREQVEEDLLRVA
ncbi:MAG: hypothetical protein DRJ42_11650 [Deltaproteobacteria bacterium]|nr:MAG: hypothetical protein DRJ42_11650 [Deltaproteobacteria bacterium]